MNAKTLTTAKTEGASLPALGLGALGVVFGDIGTSPLYTLKTVLAGAGERPPPEAVLGVLSLVIWTLIVVAWVKYVLVAMRVDNRGEGGILALIALLGMKRERPVLIAIGLFGAALVYGDGAITPAISVLTALEGLKVASPGLADYALPGTVVILLLLFAVQSRGTASIGRVFGPIMVLWFVTIAVLGLWGVVRHPAVLAAIDPLYAVRFLAGGGVGRFLVLGGVFLCVTGAEALYADMGHFGARPIRLAWTVVVFPALVLNYAGQAALVLDGAELSDNIFFRLCPAPLVLPLVILSTVATIIASQAIITGAFSMTRQAIWLGWLPRLRVVQTSEEGYGQIYVGVVNWLLMLVTLALVIGFKKSDNLAAAYGIAVSGTMLITTCLLFIAMTEVLGWNRLVAFGLAGLFLVVDCAFFAANLTKVMEGGYVPLVIAAVIYGAMHIWHAGNTAVMKKVQGSEMSLDDLLSLLANDCPARVPGAAVFLTRTRYAVPPVMVWHLRHNRSLHETLFTLTIVSERVPFVGGAGRLTVDRIADNFWGLHARFGFMERPDLSRIMTAARDAGCQFDTADVVYYVGHETVVVARRGSWRWFKGVYALMQRNSEHVADMMSLPRDQVVELGREVSI